MINLYFVFKVVVFGDVKLVYIDGILDEDLVLYYMIIRE